MILRPIAVAVGRRCRGGGAPAGAAAFAFGAGGRIPDGAGFAIVGGMRVRKGQAMVELALLGPFIFVFLFLIVELGFFYGDTMYVTYAAFAGARAQQVGEDASDAFGIVLIEDELLAESTGRGAVHGQQLGRADGLTLGRSKGLGIAFEVRAR